MFKLSLLVAADNDRRKEVRTHDRSGTHSTSKTFLKISLRRFFEEGRDRRGGIFISTPPYGALFFIFRNMKTEKPFDKFLKRFASRSRQ